MGVTDQKGERKQTTGTHLHVTVTGKGKGLVVTIQDSEKISEKRENGALTVMVGKRLG